MNRALQCLPSFQNFLKERGFEKVKNGRASGGSLATKKEGYRFISLPPWTRTRFLISSQPSKEYATIL